MYVKILKTCEHVGVTKGEIYEAEYADYDEDKVMLLSRLGDNWDPQCSQYLSNVKILKNKKNYWRNKL